MARTKPADLTASQRLILDSGAVIALARGDTRARAFLARALELAARVESLVDQPGLRKSFGAAAKRNAQNFSVEKICEQYERLYMSLLEEKGMGKAVLAKSPLERGV